MKKSSLILAAIAALAVTPLVRAAAPEVTVTGEGKCAKCELGESKTCQNTISVTKDGKTVVYYVAQNDAAKAFHKNICQAPAKVTATGTVAEEGGKMVMTVAKIEVVK